jgi:lysyl-tRNA synthetase class 2
MGESRSAVGESALARLRRQRQEKLAALRELGIDPYPSRAVRTHTCAEVAEGFGRLEGQTVTVSGRLLLLRRQGALSFAQLQDQSGRVQLAFQRERMPGETGPGSGIGYGDLRLLDVGDFVQLTGTVEKTRRGEVSVFGDRLDILAKSLRPLPDKHKGLQDPELLLRKRYLDTVLDPELHAHFQKVSRITRAVRDFLFGRGFLEFQTPVLQPLYGGGTARPFTTHVNALDIDAYLSISHELYLKRLIAAGYERVFTIGRYFRNEGIDRSHHPEFSMVETMTAFENYEYNMALVEDLFRHVAESVFGDTRVTVAGHDVDFAPTWKRLSMQQAVIDATGVDFLACADAAEANRRLSELGVEPAETPGLAMLAAFEARVEPTLVAPTIVYGHPVEMSPLAKPSAADPRVAERFEIFIGGLECGDNWTEQNDPEALLATWKRLREASFQDPEEAHPLDYDFIEMLEYGMPPTTGIGPGVERMAMILTGRKTLDDVVFFPLMRPAASELNREIYGEEAAAPAQGAAPLVVHVSELEELLGHIKPRAKSLHVEPVLVLESVESGPRRGFGHVRVENWAPNREVIVSGFPVEADDPKAALKSLAKAAGAQVVAPLRQAFPDLPIDVSSPQLSGEF